MAFWEDDLPAFFDDFAATVIADPDGSANTFQAIFDNDFLEQDGGYGAELSTRNPVISCKTTDADSFLPQGAEIEIGGVRYTVVDVESDGTGVSIVPLFKV